MPLPIFVSRNGELILPAQASISVFNPAIYGAFGVYESLQVRHGVVFAQQEHLKRLARSAAILKLPLPANPTILDRWIADVLRANGARDCTLRVFIIGPEAGSEAIIFIWPQPPPQFPASFYAEGVPVVSFEGARFCCPRRKAEHPDFFPARRAAQEAGAHEALLYHDGCLTEGSNSNLFAVIAGEVVTPPADEVLAGVTRIC